jgi:hypothetical protein
MYLKIEMPMNLLHDVLHGVGEPLVEGDEAVVVRVHRLEVIPALRHPSLKYPEPML